MCHLRSFSRKCRQCHPSAKLLRKLTHHYSFLIMQTLIKAMSVIWKAKCWWKQSSTYVQNVQRKDICSRAERTTLYIFWENQKLAFNFFLLHSNTRLRCDGVQLFQRLRNTIFSIQFLLVQSINDATEMCFISYSIFNLIDTAIGHIFAFCLVVPTFDLDN